MLYDCKNLNNIQDLPISQAIDSRTYREFFVLKDKNRPTEPHGFSGEIIISKCVIVLVTYNSFPTYIWFTSVL